MSLSNDMFVSELLAYADRAALGGVSGGEIARVLERLVSMEIAEGGPYAYDARTPDMMLNLAAANFLRACDVSLPKLDAYIARAWTKGARSRSERALKKRLDTLSRVPRVSSAKLTAAEARVLRRIRDHAAKRFSALAPEIAAAAHRILQRTIEGNPDMQMTLMPHYLRESLGSAGKQFSDERVAELGFANACFWTSFIVYDDFWDNDEAAEPLVLPAANLLARHYVDHFARELPASRAFHRFFVSTMDTLDASNTWEVAHCRMRVDSFLRVVPKTLPAYDIPASLSLAPRANAAQSRAARTRRSTIRTSAKDANAGLFGIKFYPASGHVLGPVAMMLDLGHEMQSPEVRNLLAYFTHYLIAMQINDDAHDWKEDLDRGHISTAVWLLLKRWRAAHPDRAEIHMKEDMPELEHLFWFETLRPACEAVLVHCEKSRHALESVACLRDRTPLERYIIRNEQAAREAINEQQTSVDFLHALKR